MWTDLATYIQETKTYLWKPNDDELEANLPKIIRQAEARIRTDLKLQENEVTAELSVTADTFALPADCDTLRSIHWELHGPGTYTTPRDFSRAVKRPLYPGAIRESQRRVNDLEYTVRGRVVYHRRTASVEAPANVILTYQPRAGSITTPPPDEDTSLYDAYEDMFDFAVYHYALLWLNDEERAAAFDGRYTKRLGAALAEEGYRRYGEGPLKKQMPRRDVS